MVLEAHVMTRVILQSRMTMMMMMMMIYIYYDEVCVCLSRKIITSHFRAERPKRKVSRPLGLAGRRLALA